MVTGARTVLGAMHGVPSCEQKGLDLSIHSVELMGRSGSHGGGEPLIPCVANLGHRFPPCAGFNPGLCRPVQSSRASSVPSGSNPVAGKDRPEPAALDDSMLASVSEPSENVSRVTRRKPQVTPEPPLTEDLARRPPPVADPEQRPPGQGTRRAEANSSHACGPSK